MAELGTLTYFPVLAKGLAPALAAEHSGLPYKGNKDTGFTKDLWPKLKASGRSPFGQLPILETPGNVVVGQTMAICNHIGKVAGTEGKDLKEYTMSQMVMADGEDLYMQLQKYQPTLFAKQKSEDNTKFWAEIVPAHLKKLEALIQPKGSVVGGCLAGICGGGGGGGKQIGFTSTGTTPGELVLFSYLFQMSLINEKFLNSTPRLGAWFNHIKAMPATERVVSGESPMGTLMQYFIEKQPEPTPEPPPVATTNGKQVIRPLTDEELEVYKKAEVELAKKAEQRGEDEIVVGDLTLKVSKDVFHPEIFDVAGLYPQIYAALRVRKGSSFLEVGTGIGYFALQAAKNGCKVTALDINPAAVECSKENAECLGVDHRVTCLESDVYKALEGSGEKFDTIWWNHPYIRTISCNGDLSEVQKSNLVDEEYRGLARFLREGRHYLSSGGKVMVMNSQQTGDRGLFHRRIAEAAATATVVKTFSGASSALGGMQLQAELFEVHYKEQSWNPLVTKICAPI